MREEPSYVFAGRFQPPHIGHLSIVEHVLDQYDDSIVIGIVNPDPWENPFDDSESFEEFTLDKNPLNYWERFQLLHQGVTGTAGADGNTSVVPLPRPSVHKQKANRFLPHGRKAFVLAKPADDDTFESWKETKYRNQGYDIVNVDRSDFDSIVQLASGTLIRGLAAIGDPAWKTFVQDCTIPYLREIRFEHRVAEHISRNQAIDDIKSCVTDHPKERVAKEVIQNEVVFDE